MAQLADELENKLESPQDILGTAVCTCNLSVGEAETDPSLEIIG